MLDSTAPSPTALLIYDDLAAAQEYLVRVFGFTAGPLQRDGEGSVVYAVIRAGDQVIWLWTAGEGYQSPRTLGAVTGITMVAVDDADAHYARSLAAGVEIGDAPTDQEYGAGVRVREYSARDLEGQLWSFFHSLLD